MQRVAFQSDDLTIRGTLVMPKTGTGPFPGVIILHGMTSSEAGYIPLAVSLAERGIAGLTINMRGHGESEGDFHKATVAEAINDAVAAYDFLIAQPGIDPDRIGFYGSSVGAILAGLATEQRAIRSLAFRVPASYTPEMMQISMADTMANEGQQFHEIENLAATPAGHAVEQFTGSFLVVASEKDTIIPPTITNGYLDIAVHADKKDLIVIKGATHKLTEDSWKDELTRLTVDWFTDTLRV